MVSANLLGHNVITYDGDQKSPTYDQFEYHPGTCLGVAKVGLGAVDYMRAFKPAFQKAFNPEVNRKGWAEGGVSPFTMKPYWRAVNRQGAAKAAAAQASKKEESRKASAPSISLINLIDPEAPISANPVAVSPPGNGATAAVGRDVPGTEVGVLSGATQLALRVAPGPAKKRRGSGRINSGNQTLRDRPVTSSVAYGLVEDDQNQRDEKASQKLRARAQREEEARLKRVALIDSGVKLKGDLAELSQRLGHSPTSQELQDEFTVKKLQALLAAHGQTPTGSKKADQGDHLARILRGGVTMPLLLKDKD